ncbi:MAG: OmpA family protein [Candidatus Krumholzibacteriia bacterium]
MNTLRGVAIAMILALGVAGCGGTVSRESVAYGPTFMADQAAELARRLDTAEVEPVGDGVRVRLSAAELFADDEANVLTEALPDLVKLADVLQRYEGSRVRIEGHVNPAGADARQDQLSQLRAQAVAGVLATNGVEMKRLEITGQGGSQPLADPETAVGKVRNARIEVIITPGYQQWTAPAPAVADTSGA